MAKHFHCSDCTYATVDSGVYFCHLYDDPTSRGSAGTEFCGAFVHRQAELLESQLARCPFCGGLAAQYIDCLDWLIKCTSCHGLVRSPSAKTTLDNWNMRHGHRV